MNFLIHYLPLIYMAIVIIGVELLHHRKVSEKAIHAYGKDSIHKKNNPELYTKKYVTSEIKEMRSSTYGVILILGSVFLLIGTLIIGNSSISEYGQNTLFVWAVIATTFIYGVTKNVHSKKTKLILLLSFYVPIGIGIYVGELIFNNDNQSINTDQKIPKKTNINNTVFITKSGSKWIPTKKENVYYHVVKYGESLEYIFNDITISLAKAQEQHFNILKKNEANKFEIIPIGKYTTELQNNTFLYSGLHPGDTVFMLKHELEKFCLEKEL